LLCRRALTFVVKVFLTYGISLLELRLMIAVIQLSKVYVVYEIHSSYYYLSGYIIILAFLVPLLDLENA